MRWLAVLAVCGCVAALAAPGVARADLWPADQLLPAGSSYYTVYRSANVVDWAAAEPPGSLLFDEGTADPSVCLGLPGDSCFRLVTLAQPFAFYDVAHDNSRVYDTVVVSGNGYLDLYNCATGGCPDPADPNFQLQATEAFASSALLQQRTRIAPLWENWAAGQVYFLQQPGAAVVTWDAMRLLPGDATGHATFQVVLSADGSIDFNYAADDAAYLDTPHVASIGLANADVGQYTILQRTAGAGQDFFTAGDVTGLLSQHYNSIFFGPSAQQTPELSSLALFGSALASAGGYALLRLRARRR